mmetsp:Transcript_12940/g.16367  ORF Transcript_12940/g.16367 Transcript_12940/m.16367 type:complete len:179 (+) Transcript_12940:434-970(+)
MQDKKTLQKLTPESVPLYMQGYVGSTTCRSSAAPGVNTGVVDGIGTGTHQFVYYGPMIPGQHLNPAMGDIMHHSTSTSISTSTAQHSKVLEGGGEEKVEEKEEAWSKEGDEDVMKGEDIKENNMDGDKTDNNDNDNNNKRKSTNLGEDVESPSGSKHQKLEESKAEEEEEEEENFVSI